MNQQQRTVAACILVARRQIDRALRREDGRTYVAARRALDALRHLRRTMRGK